MYVYIYIDILSNSKRKNELKKAKVVLYEIVPKHDYLTQQAHRKSVR